MKKLSYVFLSLFLMLAVPYSRSLFEAYSLLTKVHSFQSGAGERRETLLSCVRWGGVLNPFAHSCAELLWIESEGLRNPEEKIQLLIRFRSALWVTRSSLFLGLTGYQKRYFDLTDEAIKAAGVRNTSSIEIVPKPHDQPIGAILSGVAFLLWITITVIGIWKGCSADGSVVAPHAIRWGVGSAAAFLLWLGAVSLTV